MTSTFWPASASATARLHDVSVLPVPPFGPSTQTSRPRAARRPRCPRPGRRAIALLIANRSCSFDCGKIAMSAAPDLERPPEEPVRRGGREDDDRHVGRRAMRAVDDLQRPVVLAALAGDDDDVRVVRLERPDRLVDALGHPEELEARVVGQAALHVEGVEPFDGDDCADRVFHGRLP